MPTAFSPMFGAATLALAPALIAQGRRVRNTIPVLPEPPGERQGVAGTGPALRLLLLGDSAAAGVGAPNQTLALSGQLVARLGLSYRLSWRLHARSGAKLAELHALLDDAPEQAYDAVLISAGVNDVTALTRRNAWQQQYESLITRLQQKHAAKLILPSILPPMHRFPSLPQPLRWYLGQRARHLNTVLVSICCETPDCELLAPELPLVSAMVAEDGFHPAAPAYAIWAEAAARAIERRFPLPDDAKVRSSLQSLCRALPG